MADGSDDAAQMNEHQLTQDQWEAIENEIKATQSLTSPLLPISVLLQQYTTNGGDSENNNNEQQGFIKGATFLSKKYNSLRKIRGDGNCYYRAFLYSLCEHLLRNLILNDNSQNAALEFGRLKDLITKSLKWVCQYGYEEYTIDMFYDELVELFDFIEKASLKKEDSTSDTNVLLESALQQLHTKLNEENAVSADCFYFVILFIGVVHSIETIMNYNITLTHITRV